MGFGEEEMLHSSAAAAAADGPGDEREEQRLQPQGTQQQRPHMHPAAAEDPAADAAATTTTTPTHAADREPEDQAPPVFWSTRHARSASYHSLNPQHRGPGPIQLEDHTEDQHEQSQGCWARAVTVDDYTVVSGTSGIGAYVVWHCTVKTLKGGDMNIRKRYVLERNRQVFLLDSFFSPCLFPCPLSAIRNS